MHHEYHDGLCRHCGQPKDRMPDKAVCPVNKYGEPSRRACEAIGRVYVDFDTREKYAAYRNPRNPDYLRRMEWDEIEAILALDEAARAVREETPTIVLVRKYLKRRNIGDETFSEYAVGWDDAMDNIFQQLEKAGIPVEWRDAMGPEDFLE